MKVELLCRPFFILLACMITCSGYANENVFEYDAGPQAKCRLSIAKFRLWKPEKVEKINGVIIVTPGRNGDGRHFADDASYQELATKWGFAIMANFLHGIKTDKDTYQLDMGGNTADLLIDALDEFAEITKHEELEDAPLFLFGSSAGGNVSVQFAGHNPKRTIGVVGYIPTVGPGGNASKKTNIPMLIAIGAKDRSSWVKQSDSVWNKYGKRSFWTYAKHKELGHNARPAKALGMAFADAAISQRLIPEGNGSFKKSFAKLKAQWVGNLSSYEIKKATKSRLGKDECWLPDEATAKEWKKYLTTSFGK